MAECTSGDLTVLVLSKEESNALCEALMRAFENTREDELEMKHRLLCIMDAIGVM